MLLFLANEHTTVHAVYMFCACQLHVVLIGCPLLGLCFSSLRHPDPGFCLRHRNRWPA